MTPILIILLTTLIAAFAVWVVIPVLVLVCYKKNITDAPDYRKLQKRPVPVLGGLGVYVGTIIALLCSIILWRLSGGEATIFQLFVPVMISSIMLYVGLFDDLIGLRPRTKFIFQILTICLLWAIGGLSIHNFHGLFGVYDVEWYVALPFSIFVGVGMINAINLIDGVNGLSSGFGILSCVGAGLYFYVHLDYHYALFSFLFAGALFPFFIYNVFSRKYKIFIGDSGSLVMGTIAYVLVSHALSYDFSNSPYYWFDDYVVALFFALYAIPVVDCLRVMLSRMKHGKSPFNPDKTHLHHYLIKIGCSHFLTTFAILSLCCGEVLLWLITAATGMNVDLQFILVVIFSLLLCVGVYYYIDFVSQHKPRKALHDYHAVRRFLAKNRNSFYAIQRFIDRKSYGKK